MKFEVLDRVRWSDCDPFGIIYYGAYIRLFQVAEEEMFRACGLPYATLREEKGVWIPRKAFAGRVPLARAESMKRSRCRCTSRGSARPRITMQFEVYRASDRAHRASGTLTVVCGGQADDEAEAAPARREGASYPSMRGRPPLAPMRRASR